MTIDSWHFSRGTSTWDDLAAIPLLNRELQQLPVAEFATRAFQSASRYWD